MTGNDNTDTSSNLYAPPQTQIAEPQAQGVEQAPFYVVSALKVTLLTLATFGFYTLYWFWKHWKQHKRDKKLDIWPVPRAIFSIFFAHSLNHEFDHLITRNRSGYAWSPDLWATLFVVAAIASRIANRLPENIISLNASMVVTIVALVAITISLVQAQRAANVACGDPAAAANSHLTAANWVWLVLGGLFWALVMIGMTMSEDALQ